MAQKWGAVRVRDFITRVRGVFKYGHESELIAVSVRFGPGFKPPTRKTLRLGRAEKGARMFEAAEIRALVNGATIQGKNGPKTVRAGIAVRAMILLGVNCEFGNADCGTLPRSAIDLESGWVNYHRPKTGITRRCPLWPETIDALNDALDKRPEPKNPEDAGLVFLTVRGASWHKTDLEDSTISKEISKLVKALGSPGTRTSTRYAIRLRRSGARLRIRLRWITSWGTRATTWPACSYGSPAYAELDGWTRGLFEAKLADNSWRIVTDRLRSEARLEGVTFSPEMLSAAAERYSHAIGPGAPLSPGDRRVCILLAAELWPIVTELQTRAWIENPTPPPELVTQSRDEPGYMGRASFVMFQLLNEQILETSTPIAFTPLKVLEVKHEAPRSLLAHAGNSPDPTKQPKPANQFRPYRIENQKLIVTVGSVERSVDLTPRQRETLEFVIAAGEVGVALCNVTGVPASYSDFIRQIKTKLAAEELPDYIRTPGDGGKGAGGIYSIRPL